MHARYSKWVISIHARPTILSRRRYCGSGYAWALWLLLDLRLGNRPIDYSVDREMSGSDIIGRLVPASIRFGVEIDTLF